MQPDALPVDARRHSQETTWRRDQPATPRSGQRPSRASDIQLIRGSRRILLVTEGHSSREYSKTAEQVLRYRPDDVAAVLDSERAGEVAEGVFGVGGQTPIFSRLEEVAEADSIFIGIAPPGGELPAGWSRCLAEGVARGLPLVSGLHTPLVENRELAKASAANGARLIDLRHSDCRRIATAPPAKSGCLRVLTVGSDCSVGKMSAAKEIELEMNRRGRDAAFLATGQTGIMIGGDGVVIDAVVSDFVNGVIEQLVVQHERHAFVIVEGQGSIVHPAYSGVSLGLLHGAAPDALVLCHELGRENLKSLRHVPVLPLRRLIEHHEKIAGVRRPCRVIGLALNGRRIRPEEAARQIERIESELGLPACDVYRDGADRLVEAIERLADRLPASEQRCRSQPQGITT